MVSLLTKITVLHKLPKLELREGGGGYIRDFNAKK